MLALTSAAKGQGEAGPTGQRNRGREELRLRLVARAALLLLRGYELTIVAEGFARIFLQNSINLGLNLVTAPDLEASEGDELEVTADTVVNKTKGKRFAVIPLPKARQAIIDAGGLIAFARKRVMQVAGRA